MRTRTKGRSCDGKRRFERRETANNAIRSLVKAKKAVPENLHSYTCGYCKGWHIGHTRHGQRRSR